MMKSKVAVFFLGAFLCLISFPGYTNPADSMFETETRIDWTEGVMYLELRFTPPSGSGMSPSVRRQAVEAAKKELPSLFMEAVGRINADSRYRIGEKLFDSPDLAEKIRALALRGEIRRSSFNQDFTSFIQVFAYPLYPDIAELFISHPRALPQIPVLEYVAGGKYSGIVIFVENPLPLYGANQSAALEPALFPRVHSPEMDCIFDRYMVDPEKLSSGGMLRYFPDTRIDEIHVRVGEVPLYVHAVGIFGINHTDLIVSGRAALRMRADEHTLSLLRNGRVAIVYSPE